MTDIVNNLAIEIEVFWSIIVIAYKCVTTALDISTGPAHFSDRRASAFYLSLARTDHQISNSAGPNDDKSQYVLFAWALVPHLGSFRAVLLL